MNQEHLYRIIRGGNWWYDIPERCQTFHYGTRKCKSFNFYNGFRIIKII